MYKLKKNHWVKGSRLCLHSLKEQKLQNKYMLQRDLLISRLGTGYSVLERLRTWQPLSLQDWTSQLSPPDTRGFLKSHRSLVHTGRPKTSDYSGRGTRPDALISKEWAALGALPAFASGEHIGQNPRE